MAYIGYDPSAPGTISVQRFSAGSGFTAGSTTTLTITSNPGSANNIDVYFDGQYQHHDQWSITGTTITFTAAIPLGTSVVEVKYGNSVAINVPADGSVTAAKMAVPPLWFSGRLTLASGTPVMTSDQTAKTTIYFTPYNGNLIPIYDGTRMVLTEFSELSQATTDATKSPAAVTTNSNYDLFVWNDSGVIRCTRGPAWSSSTARGTGAGTTELEMVKGVYLNKVAITNGPAANRGTYVGTVRSNGSSQIDWKLGSSAAGGGEAWLGLWSMYNRVTVCPSVQDTVDSYTYQSTTIRSMNNSATNRISFIQGLAEDGIIVNKKQLTLNSATDTAYLGVSLDATDSYTDGLSQASTAAVAGGTAIASMVRSSLLGWHFAQAVESCSSATNACTFYGDAGGATTKTIMAGSLRM